MKKFIADNVRLNLLNGDFKAEQSNKKWVTDITYLAYEGHYVYLSTIIDLVAAVISNKNDLKLVKDPLEMALSKEKDVHRVVLHSDQGFQYTSYEYRTICEANGITISMSRKGTPSDNAPIESFHSSLKRETLYNYNITNLKEYISLVEKWLEKYNNVRLRLPS